LEGEEWRRMPGERAVERLLGVRAYILFIGIKYVVPNIFINDESKYNARLR